MGMGSGREGDLGTPPAPPWPRTHAGSSPEGDAAFDEEHPRVAVADHEQHAAEAQVDEADEDLDRLRGAGGRSARRAGRPHTALCRPRRAARREAPRSPSQLLAAEGSTPIPLFATTTKDRFEKERLCPPACGPRLPVSTSLRGYALLCGLTS